MNKTLLPLLLSGLALAGCDRKAPAKPVAAASAVVSAEAASTEAETDEKEEKAKKDEKTGTVAAVPDPDATDEKPRSKPGAPKDDFPRKMDELKLSPSEIEAELAKTGRVVRELPPTQRRTPKEPLDDGHVATVINIKYSADSHLFSSKVNVNANDGVATLSGTLKSSELVGRAIYLALNTEGVRQVVSQLTVDPTK